MRRVGKRDRNRVLALSHGRRRRGAAMIEAVIVLPILLLTWAGVSFMRERFLGRQQALLAARRCAWAHAVSGCGQPPEGCTSEAQLAAEPAQGSAAIMHAARDRSAMKSIDVFNDIPVLGEVLGALFGSQTGASAVACTPLPWDRERGLVDRVELVVGCNERPRNVLRAALDVFCENVKVVPCD